MEFVLSGRANINHMVLLLRRLRNITVIRRKPQEVGVALLSHSRCFYSINTITSSLSRKWRNLNPRNDRLTSSTYIAIDRDGSAGFTKEQSSVLEGF